MRFTVILLLLVSCLTARAAVIPAASTAYADVQAAINLSSDGDEVDVPGGTATWVNILPYTKNITIRGSGTNSTHIINGIPPSQGSGYNNGHGGALFEVRCGATWRITGIFFDGARDGTATGGGIPLEILGGSQNGRIDHCLFYKSPTYGVQTFSWNYGVIDHCQFTECKVSVSCNMDNQGAWLRPNPIGTTHQWVMEDNSIDMHGAWDSSNVGDGSYGASYTWRYCVCNSTYSGFDVFVENHGNQGPPSFATPLTAPSVLRSVVCMECYFNTLNVSTANGFFSHRGGTLFGFGNVATCADHSSVLGTFNFAHGGTEEDGWRNGNSPFTAWPPYDGITNSYFWHETVNGVVDAGFGLLFPGQTPCLGSFSQDLRCPSPASDGIFIQDGRDYFLHAPSTSFYKPLRYPHPRVIQDNDPPLPAVFGLVAPADGAGTTTQPTLQWSPSAGANAFTVEVAADYYFTVPVHSATVMPIVNSYPIPAGALTPNTTFFWRVKALSNNGGVYSGTLNTADIRSFFTATGVSLAAQSVQCNETDGSVTITVNKNGVGACSVNYATADNTATAGNEYNAVSGTLTFAPNTTSMTFTVPINDVHIFSAQVRTFFVNLSNPVGALLQQAQAIVSINMNSSPPQNQPPFTPGNVSPANGATQVSLTPTLTATAYSDPQGSPQAGSQWQVLSNGVPFYLDFGGPNTSYSSFSPNTFANGTTYSWQVQYRNSLNLYSAWSNPTLFTTTNGPAPPTNSPPNTPSNVSPANASINNPLTPTLVASAYSDPGPIPQLNSQFQIIQNGTTNWGAFGGVANQLTVPASILASASTYTWQGRYQNSSNLWSAWSAPTSFSTTNVIVPPPSVFFAWTTNAYSVGEAGGSITLIAHRSGSLTGAVTVAYATTAGSAVDGHDFTGGNGTFSWTPGDGADKTVTFAVLNSGDTAATNRQFTCTLTNASGAGAMLSSPIVATVTIIMAPAANSPGSYAFSQSLYNTTNTAGTVTVTVIRSGATNVQSSVSYVTQDISAVAGTDYTASSGTINFGTVSGTQSFSIPILPSGKTGPQPLSLLVRLLNPTGGATLGLAQALVSIQIPQMITVTTTATASGKVLFSGTNTFSTKP